MEGIFPRIYEETSNWGIVRETTNRKFCKYKQSYQHNENPFKKKESQSFLCFNLAETFADHRKFIIKGARVTEMKQEYPLLFNKHQVSLATDMSFFIMP